MEVIIEGNPVEIVIVRKNNKNIYLRFKEDQKLYATCNRFVREKDILNLIKTNEAKITKMYQAITKQTNNDYFFNYLGKKYTICYLDNVNKTYIDGDLIYTPSSKDLTKFYNQEVIRVFTKEVNRIIPYFSNIPKFTLKFRKMKSRWGVNNLTKRSITLNTELLKKDLDLLDYVIIHELCHFYEANHSSRFWNHVAKYYPRYKEARKRLKE